MLGGRLVPRSVGRLGGGIDGGGRGGWASFGWWRFFAVACPRVEGYIPVCLILFSPGALANLHFCVWPVRFTVGRRCVAASTRVCLASFGGGVVHPSALFIFLFIALWIVAPATGQALAFGGGGWLGR